jgi:hypothetical protein
MRKAESMVAFHPTLHRVARFPFELSRITAELIVRAEDEGDVGCVRDVQQCIERRERQCGTHSYA